MNIMDFSIFNKALEDHDLNSRWSDTLFEMTKQETEKFVEEKLLEAREDFTRMMNSNKNNGSMEYHLWAINTALKLKINKANYRSKYNGKL